MEKGLKVQRYAEQKARENGLRGVTTVIFSQAFADLAQNFDYKKLPENSPEIQERDMSHFGACLLCDEEFGRQCEAQVEREFQLLDRAKALVNSKMWCGHTVNVIADILMDRENGEELAKRIIQFANQVAAEKGHPVVRPLFLHYPNDEQTYGLRHQFMLGPDFVVAPVLKKGAKKVRLYLPEGRWQHVWSGAILEKGWHKIDAPVGQPAVFFRASSDTASDLAGQMAAD